MSGLSSPISPIDAHDLNPTMQSMPDLEDLEEWYLKYMAQESDRMSQAKPVIQVVEADILDEEQIENSIRDMMSSVSMSEGICAKCQEALDDWPEAFHASHPSAFTRDGHESTRMARHTLELQASARGGCRFCRWMMQTLTDGGLLQIFRKIEMRMKRLGKTVWTSLTIVKVFGDPTQIIWLNYPGKVGSSQSRGDEQRFTSHLLPDSGTLADFHKGLVPLCLTFTAPCYDPPWDVLDLAKAWLQDCLKNHELCQKAYTHARLPTRLIDVSGNGIRLVETLHWTTSPAYSTLSHAWGSKPFLKLTPETHNAFLNSIPLENLTKTFKDAIHITRELGISFLWIDSLCIIQDEPSKEDWERESAHMASIYGSSTINIAASCAVDGSQGCFMPLEVSGGLRAKIRVNGKPGVRAFHNGNSPMNPINSCHLATRAWAVQERILPLRTIHFGTRGTLWECRSKDASEFLPTGFKDERGSFRTFRKTLPLRDMWETIVKSYSKANLTFDEDKLPALSGIAQQMHEEVPDQYLAGLWKKDINDHLYWTTDAAKKRPRHPAPTWSWASVNTQVTLRRTQRWQLDDYYSHFHDSEIRLTGQDPFGQVARGVIRISCSLMATGLVIGPSDPSSEASNLFYLKVTTDMPDLRGMHWTVRLDCIEEDRDLGDTLYLLPFRGWWEGAWRTSADTPRRDRRIAISGILLRSTKTRKGEYERLGSFWFSGAADESEGPRNAWPSQPRRANSQGEEPDHFSFLRILEQTGAAVAEQACSEVIENSENPDERFLISIV